MSKPSQSGTQVMTVLVYSHDASVRRDIANSLGRRPAPELPPIEIVEIATEPAVIRRVDAGGIDVIVLDGEAVPAGGMGISKQLKDEIFRCPPVLLVVARPDDAWLATWSRADAVVSHPIDPVSVADAVAGLMRRRLAGPAAS